VAGYRAGYGEFRTGWKGKLMTDKDAARAVVSADNEIDKIFLQYHNPLEELLTRYERKNEADKSVMVMALLGKVMYYRARMKGMPGV
jgi:hypothetical protein